MLLSTNKLLIIIYLTICLEWILNDEFIVIRYLHFSYLFFFLSICCLAIYLVLSNPKKLLWLTPALTFVSINFFSPLLPTPTPPEGKEQLSTTREALKLLSFSINSQNTQYDQVGKLLLNNPSSLICLQEIPYSRYKHLLKIIDHQLPNYHHVYSKKKSLMILSKTPIKRLKTAPYLKATTNIGQKKVTLWNLHSPKSLHIKQYQSDYFHKLQEDIKEDNTPYKIICGDFNSTPHNDIIQRLKHNFNAAYQQTFWPPSYTYPTPKSFIASPLPFIKIDFFLLSKNINVLQYQHLKNNANSDHYPIKTTVTLQE